MRDAGEGGQHGADAGASSYTVGIISSAVNAVPPHRNPSQETGIDQQRVRALFSFPQAVAASGFLRREISQRMQERLDIVKLVPETVLDAGCGAGEDLVALRRRYPRAQRIGADISNAMIAAARIRCREAEPFLRRVLGRLFGGDTAPTLHCCDLASLPQANGSVALLWSNLALHWHPQPQAVFGEWARVLRTEGLLSFSCFGPDSFKELRQAFATVDDYPHVLPFVDMHDLGDMLMAAGFGSPVMDMEKVTVTYELPQQLIADVRAFGGNPLSHRRRGLMGRESGRRVVQALEAMRGGDGTIPLSFEIVYGHAFKPEPTVNAQGEAIVRLLSRR